MLHETVEKIQEAHASAATTSSDIASSECEVCVDAEHIGQSHQIILACLAEEVDDDVKECKATFTSSKSISYRSKLSFLYAPYKNHITLSWTFTCTPFKSTLHLYLSIHPSCANNSLSL